jgi:hypothetical protein
MRALVILWIIFLNSVVFAQNPPIDFSDVNAVLTQAETIRKDGLALDAEGFLKKLNGFLANDAALLEAYKNAYSAVNFEGGKKEQARVKDWEEKNKALFSSDGFIWVLRAHVQYLVATIHKKIGKDDQALALMNEWIKGFPKTEEDYAKFMKHEFFVKNSDSKSASLKAFSRSGIEQFKLFARNELFSNGMGGSVFLREANLTALAHGVPNWHMGDLGNVADIHRVNVISFLRSKKDQAVFEEWKKNIQLEQDLYEREGLVSKVESFKLSRRPWLLWQVGKDYEYFNQPRQAVDLMLSAIKENPRCEDYDKIVADIKRIVASCSKPSS